MPGVVWHAYGPEDIRLNCGDFIQKKCSLVMHFVSLLELKKKKSNIHTLLEKMSQATKLCLFLIKLLQVRYFISCGKTSRNHLLGFSQGVKLVVACGRVTLKAGNT